MANPLANMFGSTFDSFPQLLPKHLLVHARKLDKEEIDKRVLDTLKKESNPPTPLSAPMFVSSGNMTISTFSPAWGNTTTSYTLNAGDTITYTANNSGTLRFQ